MEKLAVVALMAAVLALACHGQAQQLQTTSTPSCATKLLPCLDSLNLTGAPPETCCKPLSEAVSRDMPCLCVIFSSPEILRAFNVELRQAMRLATECGVSSGQILCPQGGAPPSASPPAESRANGDYAMSQSLSWIGVLLLMFMLLC